MKRTVPGLCLLLALSTIAPAAAKPEAAAAWKDEVAAWKKTRVERLQRPDGWLTLVGLGWLKEGDNSVGSDPKSVVVLPAGKAPAHLGILRVAAGKVTFIAAKGTAGTGVTTQGVPVSTLALVDDSQSDPTLLDVGSVTFFAIRRGDRLGVRVKDREAATLKAFHGLDYFPLAGAWRIAGKFEPASEVREVPIPNALGFDEPIKSPGHVVFAVDGQEVRLLALDDTGDGRLFLVFGDRTNGHETYGGGRFLYTDPPQDGQVVLDFNRSYNPPCVFTPYATCPLPPRENRLPFRVEAGEKSFAGHRPKP